MKLRQANKSTVPKNAKYSAKVRRSTLWLKPVLVGRFVEWTPDNHLRHSRFIALREDKPAAHVRREA